MSTAAVKTKKKKSSRSVFWANMWTKGGIDIPFLLLTFVLLTVGLIMLLSASYSYSYYYEDGDSLYYFKRQAIFAVVGIVAMFVISKLNYNYFRLLAWPMFIVVTGLLVLVLLLPASFGDFHRWINLGAFSFQPSELAKVAIVIFCAYKMEQEHEKLRVSTKAMWKYLILTLVYAGLVFAENHVSGAILAGALGVVMMFLGGVKMRWFAIGGALAIAAVTLVILKPDILPGHASVRIVAWLDKDYQPRGARWQTNQSLYAIGSGGLMGAGLGQSKQKHLYVSEPQNDFIFAIVCEELGFIGAVAIILLFALLVWRGFVVALRAPDRFGSLLVMGLISQIGIQVALNICVVTDTLPNTGISLPFFSYGGTSLCVLLAEIGMILAVSRRSVSGKSQR